VLAKISSARYPLLVNIPSDFRLPSWKIPIIEVDLSEIDVPQIAEKVSEYGKEALYVMATLQKENPELETHITEIVDHAKSIATSLCNKLNERSPLRNA
jgi:hypothetical protein